MKLFESDGVVIWREPDCIRLVDLYSKASEFASSVTSGDEVLWERHRRMSKSIHGKVLAKFYRWEANGRTRQN